MRTPAPSSAKQPPVATLVWGLAALALGLTVYLLARPAGSTLLSANTWSLADWGRPMLPALLPLTGSLPTLCHTMAFSLLGGVALGSSRRGLLASITVWLVLGTAFEVLQHPAAAGALLWPPLPADTPLAGGLALLSHYAQAGTFDPLDLLAVFTGGGLAYLVGRSSLPGRRVPVGGPA